MGYKEGDIGTHSICKGAISYLASLAGGPPATATCICAGWTKGNVKDVYMHYLTLGDQFVGQCLALHPVLQMSFRSSPPYLVENDDADWIENLRSTEFRMHSLIAGFLLLTTICLASTLYHREWLVSDLQVNHVFLVTSNCFWSGDRRRNNRENILRVTFPCTDNNKAFCGIHPQVALFQEVTQLKENKNGWL